jgi:hypothetical protein
MVQEIEIVKRRKMVSNGKWDIGDVIVSLIRLRFRWYSNGGDWGRVPSFIQLFCAFSRKVLPPFPFSSVKVFDTNVIIRRRFYI